MMKYHCTPFTMAKIQTTNNTVLTSTWNNSKRYSLLQNTDIQNGTATLHSLTMIQQSCSMVFTQMN